MDAILQIEEERMLEEAGFHKPYLIDRLKAGRNNRVYEIVDEANSKAVLKRYFHHSGDQRDRLKHEWKFLTYAENCAAEFVPKLLARKDQSRVALLEFIEGKNFKVEVGGAEIDSAISFVEALNGEHRMKLGKSLPVAAEACFAVRDHIELMRKRLEKVSSINDERVGCFVANQLLPIARMAENALLEGSWKYEENVVEDRLISPSDFGFHNAIDRGMGEVCFIDFEYAGWDGAAKLICDFFSQPQVCVSEAHLPNFVDAVGKMISAKSENILLNNLPGLLLLHGVKWCCILLNEFSEVDASRREYSGDWRIKGKENRDMQFRKVERYFNKKCLPRVNAF